MERELPAMLALAQRLTGDPVAAEDAVQDALERAWRSRAQLRQAGAAQAWMRSILARRVVDLHRRERNESPAGAAGELEELLMPDVEDPAGVVAAAEDEERMRAALRALAEPDRVALVLHDGEGWTAAQVAELLGTGVAAAQKRVQRARSKLVGSLASAVASRAPAGACTSARRQAHGLLDGGLDPRARHTLERHLASCPHCPAALQAATGVLARLRRLPEGPVSDALAERLRGLIREGFEAR